jgi:hypothetical protein
MMVLMIRNEGMSYGYLHMYVSLCVRTYLSIVVVVVLLLPGVYVV